MSPIGTRRQFLRDTAILGAAAGFGFSLAPRLFAQEAEDDLLYKISLAGYSKHRAMESGELDPRDLAPYVKEHYDIDAVEQWNRPFLDKATDAAYMGEMKQKAIDAGVKFVLIMIDDEGNLGEPDQAARIQVVDNHKKWVEAAKELGGHSIRVNARSQGTPEEQAAYCADGLRRLAEFAATMDMNVIVENHGGLSSNGQWVVGVMKQVDLENCGTLPDFGNFPGLQRGARFPAEAGGRGRRGGFGGGGGFGGRRGAGRGTGRGPGRAGGPGAGPDAAQGEAPAEGRGPVRGGAPGGGRAGRGGRGGRGFAGRGGFGGRGGGQAAYDPYQGVEEMMPYAKGVSAKSYGFAENGEETSLDFARLMRIVVDSGYRGHVGVEYEGTQHSEDEGVMLTKRLLEKVRDEIAAERAASGAKAAPAEEAEG